METNGRGSAAWFGPAGLTKAVVLLALATPIGTVPAGENSWVTKGGGAPAHAIVTSEDAETFDLSELADGETRVFGVGDAQVSVRREGETATIYRAATGERPELDITCRLADDSCKIVTPADHPDQVAILISRERDCVNGEGDCEPAALLTDLAHDGAGHAVLIHTRVECDGDADCATAELHQHHAGEPAVIRLETLGIGAGDSEVFVLGEGGSAAGSGLARVIVERAGDETVLRCPEGDTTMRVAREEAEAFYLCPKHSRQLERVEHAPGMPRLELIRPDGETAEH
ncbi:MAG TPA: hypothetical protein VD788_06060 [Candidatus Polarisedimenticolaceae bacterium]|nr:hypothetical protein [Candidatus Polarisedimenticolaceae bacterium]